MAALINDFGFYEISIDLFYSLSFGIYSNFFTSVQQIYFLFLSMYDTLNKIPSLSPNSEVWSVGPIVIVIRICKHRSNGI